jgi:hypothetical protein
MKPPQKWQSSLKSWVGGLKVVVLRYNSRIFISHVCEARVPIQSSLFYILPRAIILYPYIITQRKNSKEFWAVLVTFHGQPVRLVPGCSFTSKVMVSCDFPLCCVILGHRNMKNSNIGQVITKLGWCLLVGVFHYKPIIFISIIMPVKHVQLKSFF